jgi:hypothetical protein
MKPRWPGTTTPSWGILTGLCALVLGVHLLLLKAAPSRLGLALEPKPNATQAFATRSIEPPARPAPQATPAKPAPAATKVAVEPRKAAVAPVAIQAPVAAAQPASHPEIQPNTADEPAEPALPAADSIANTEPDTSPSAAEITAAPITTESAPTAAAAPAGPQTTPVTAVKLPDSVRLLYRMTGSAKGLNYHATAELDWTNSGSDYEAGMRVSALFLGSRSMSSRGQISANGLAPKRFLDKSRSERAAHFDAEAGKITFSANSPDAPWLAGAQDRVSVLLQLGGILAAAAQGAPGADRFPAGSSITVYTAGPREADNWTFLVEGDEPLSLPAGDMSTVKLTRKPHREFDQKIELWYAPSLAFVPVRSRITQANGDFIDQQLKSAERP